MNVINACSLPPLHHGDHFCLFYRDIHEQLATVVPFLSDGLKGGERCIYLGDAETITQAMTDLAAANIDVATEVKRRAAPNSN